MEQQYLVRIKSDVREAEFDVTGENGVCTSVRLKSLRYLKANPNSGHGEVMDAHIYENDDSPMNSNMLYKWIVLWGSIPEVIKEVETTCPLLCWKRMWCGMVLRRRRKIGNLLYLSVLPRMGRQIRKVRNFQGTVQRSRRNGRQNVQ